MSARLPKDGAAGSSTDHQQGPARYAGKPSASAASAYPNSAAPAQPNEREARKMELIAAEIRPRASLPEHSDLISRFAHGAAPRKPLIRARSHDRFLECLRRTAVFDRCFSSTMSTGISQMDSRSSASASCLLGGRQNQSGVFLHALFGPPRPSVARGHRPSAFVEDALNAVRGKAS